MTTRYVRVPIDLPVDVLKEFVITHCEGDTGQDAWHTIIEKVGRATLVDPVDVAEKAIVQIKDVYGEPALIFPDTPAKQVVLLLSHLSQHITGHPQAAGCMAKAVTAWKALKATGHT